MFLIIRFIKKIINSKNMTSKDYALLGYLIFMIIIIFVIVEEIIINIVFMTIFIQNESIKTLNESLISLFPFRPWGKEKLLKNREQLFNITGLWLFTSYFCYRSSNITKVSLRHKIHQSIDFQCNM